MSLSTTLHVRKPGLLSSVQDGGRSGVRRFGVSRSGAMNPRAAEIANALVGNELSTAVIEMTLFGANFEFAAPIRIAVTGAPASIEHIGQGGARTPIPVCRPVDLPPGQLVFSGMPFGARCWLAIHGGIHVGEILGSRSTDLRGGFGGLHGRALEAGDALPIGALEDCSTVSFPNWWADASVDDANVGAIRYVADMPGAKAEHRGFQIAMQSNRQGIVLEPREPLPRVQVDARRYSAAVATGTIQLPPDGRPIVLGVDAQTVGGYQTMGYVIEPDMERLSQVRGGERLELIAVSQEKADQLAAEHAAMHRRLLMSIADRLRE